MSSVVITTSSGLASQQLGGRRDPPEHWHEESAGHGIIDMNRVAARRHANGQIFNIDQLKNGTFLAFELDDQWVRRHATSTRPSATVTIGECHSFV
jgi:hypothetical protein